MNRFNTYYLRSVFRNYRDMNLRFIVEFKLMIVASVLQLVLSECIWLPCIRKCCPPGSALLFDSTKYVCQKYDVPLKIENFHEYEIIYEANCSIGKVPTDIISDEFSFSAQGELVLPINNGTIRKSPNEYCINYTDGGIISAILCTDREPDQPAVFIGK